MINEEENNSINQGVIEENIKEIVDPEKQIKAKELSKVSRIISIFEMIFTFAYFSYALFSGLTVQIRDYSENITNIWFFQLSIYCIIFFAIPSILTFPISLYSGYFLPKKYELLKQNFISWTFDEVKKLFLSIIIGIPLLAVIYKSLSWQPDNWWIWVSLGYVVLSVISMIVVPVLIMPMFAKYTPIEDEKLIEILSKLGEKSNTQIKGVFRWGLNEKTTQANAALTGLGKTRRIIISDTMLDNYTHEEIETVLAHELGHHVNKDIFRMLVMGTIITTLSLFISNNVLQKASLMWGLEGMADIANFPLLMIVLSALSLIAMPLINGYSRMREKYADLYSFKITNKPMILANALQKLANQNLSEIQPPEIIEFLFHSHPSVSKRVAFAEKYSKGQL